MDAISIILTLVLIFLALWINFSLGVFKFMTENNFDLGPFKIGSCTGILAGLYHFCFKMSIFEHMIFDINLTIRRLDFDIED